MPEFWNPNSLHYVIDWSAWATLVVGIAAVIGAVMVGQRQADIATRQANIAARQAEIMDRQTHIAEREAETERTRLRAELYDRRVEVLTGIEQYLSDASTNDGKVSNEVRDTLFRSISVARFLLGDEVEDLGRRILTASINLRSQMGRLEREKDASKTDAHVDKVMAINDQLNEQRLELRTIMERYLSISYVDDQIAKPPAA